MQQNCPPLPMCVSPLPDETQSVHHLCSSTFYFPLVNGFLHESQIRVCWQCVICVLYQTGLKYTQWLLRSTHLCFRRSFDDVTRINFRFRLLVTWSTTHGHGASSCKIWCKIQDGGRRHLGFVGGSHGTTHEGTLVVRTPCKNCVMIGSVVFKL